MSASKAYELPDREKYPDLYKSDGLIGAKLCKVIKIYSNERMSAADADNLSHFFSFFKKNNIKPSQIKKRLPLLCNKGCIREVEFVLALQGKKLEKEDIFKNNCYSALWSSANKKDKDYLLQLGDVMQRAGKPITKQDIIEAKRFYKDDDSKKTYNGRVLTAAVINGNLEQVKKVVEMNGEKLTKNDLMTTILQDEAQEKLFDNFKGNKIIFAALRTGELDIAEQILTEEGTSISINDVMSKEMKLSEKNSYYLTKLFSSPVFKDTSNNIDEVWKHLPDKYKNLKENQDGYKIAIGKAKADDARKAAQVLNKGNIAALKKAAGR